MSFNEEQKRARAQVEAKEAREAVAFLSLALVENECRELVDALEEVRAMGVGSRNKPSKVEVPPFTLVVHHKDPQYNVDPDKVPDHAYVRLFPSSSELRYVRAGGNAQFALHPRSGRTVTIERKRVKRSYVYYVTSVASLTEPSGRTIGQRTGGKSAFAGLTPRER